MAGAMRFLNLPIETWENITIDVPECERLALITAIANYNYYGTEPDNIPAGAAMATWRGIKREIDRSRGCARFGNKNATKMRQKREQNATKTPKEKKRKEKETTTARGGDGGGGGEIGDQSAIIKKIIDAYPKVRSRFEAERCVSLAIVNDAKSSGDDCNTCALRLLKRIEWFASIIENPQYIPDMCRFFYDRQYLCTDDQLRVIAKEMGKDNAEDSEAEVERRIAAHNAANETMPTEEEFQANLAYYGGGATNAGAN